MRTQPAPRLGRHTLTLAAIAWVALVAPDHAWSADWQVIGEEDGVVVSTRAVEGRSLPELRSVGEIDATPLEILAVVVDVPNHVEWRPDCVEAKTVRRIDSRTSIVYSLTNAPWPVADRELVTRSHVELEKGPRQVAVRFSVVDAPDVLGKPGAVRMERATGAWEIEAIDEGRSRVRYTVDADPGGSLPGWLVSMQTKRNPLQTLIGLRQRVEETRGRYEEQVRTFVEELSQPTP